MILTIILLSFALASAIAGNDYSYGNYGGNSYNGNYDLRSYSNRGSYYGNYAKGSRYHHRKSAITPVSTTTQPTTTPRSIPDPLGVNSICGKPLYSSASAGQLTAGVVKSLQPGRLILQTTQGMFSALVLALQRGLNASSNGTVVQGSVDDYITTLTVKATNSKRPALTAGQIALVHRLFNNSITTSISRTVDPTVRASPATPILPAAPDGSQPWVCGLLYTGGNPSFWIYDAVMISYQYALVGFIFTELDAVQTDYTLYCGLQSFVGTPYAVELIIPHPQQSDPYTDRTYGLSLVKLVDPITDPNVVPICLATTPLVLNGDSHPIAQVGSFFHRSDFVYSLINVQLYAEQATPFPNDGPVNPNTNLGAVPLPGNQCDVDSMIIWPGSPLMIQGSDGRTYLYGVGDDIILCAFPEAGFFAKTYNAYPWITTTASTN